VTIDPAVRRGATYTGVLDPNEVKEKLRGNFSIVLATAFPMYKWFPGLEEHKVASYCYEPPNDIPDLKAASMDKSIGNLLLSNLPDWAVLPEKETSATVYSSRKTADDFSKKSGEEGRYSGRMYRAVPELNSRLVIAPAARVRNSFQYALGEFGIAAEEYIGSLGKFNSCFIELFRACGMGDGRFSDWQLFLTALNDVAFEKIRPERKITKDTEKVLGILIKNKEQVIDFLEDAFSPLHNGFKVLDYNDDGLKKAELVDNEIWMASPCLLINEGLFEEMRAR
jgi:hypothetical protein